MGPLIDSFWRAVLYCLRPSVLVLTLLPLVLVGVVAGVVGYFLWDVAVAFVAEWIHASGFMGWLWQWLTRFGAGDITAIVAPLVVLAVALPLLVVLSLLIAATMMTPRIVALVARQRFPALEMRHGASVVRSVLWSLSSTAMALLVMFASMPLWLVPPLILVLPPLVWGWLTYRVMAFDVLADYADGAERALIFHRHRMPLLVMGLVAGFLGAAPAVIWASGLLFAAAFVVLIPLGIWIYTLVLAFSSLWFAHYCLSALQTLRAAEQKSIDAPK